jgi:hypothetical protein
MLIEQDARTSLGQDHLKRGLAALQRIRSETIGEIEVTDTSAQPGYLPAVRKATENAHGRSLRTLNGRVVSIEGRSASEECGPYRVGQHG